ncbi:MAG: hypothetical protein K0V04_34470 [Deltaproteobacteria bacterium]|nr:hypothetical protein [Deltaproteobacteria bacterium]
MVARRRLGSIALTVAEWSGVVLFGILGLLIVAGGIMLAWVGDPPEPMGSGQPAAAPEPTVVAPTVAFVREVPPASAEERKSLFAPVYDVLVSPRCMNCHPAGDRPLSDRFGVHAMNVSRDSPQAGLSCNTCHAEHNTELPGSPLGPPGAHGWQMPPKETPMVFEHRTVTELCTQLRDPAQNGERSLDKLLEHVSGDALVLWGWKPGGDRAIPPMSHEAFVTSFGAWVEAGGICPGDPVVPESTADTVETP